MSGRRHADTGDDSSNQCRQNSNLTTRVEEFTRRQILCQEGSQVAPLRGQLALEYRLQSLCQRLLESYKDQHDWAAVGQVAQSLVTNTQRVSLLKERLLGGENRTQFEPASLRLVHEHPHGRDCDRTLSLISEALVEQEEGEEQGTESESESSSLGKAFPESYILHRQSGETAPGELALSASLSPESGASSAVDYETASQHTSASEADPETSTTGLESLDTRSKTTGSQLSLAQLSAASTTPSPEHSSSCSVGCAATATPPPDKPRDLPQLEEPPSLPEAAGQLETDAPEPASEAEEAVAEEERESNGGDSVMDPAKPGEAGGMGECGDTNYVQMHPRVGTEDDGVVKSENGVAEQLLGDSSDSGCGEDGTLSFPRELFCVPEGTARCVV